MHGWLSNKLNIKNEIKSLKNKTERARNPATCTSNVYRWRKYKET